MIVQELLVCVLVIGAILAGCFLLVVGSIAAVLVAMVCGSLGLVRAFRITTWCLELIERFDRWLGRILNRLTRGWPSPVGRIFRAGSRAAVYLTLVITPPGLVASAYVVWYINWDPSDTPDPKLLLAYNPASIGHVYDARGDILVRMADEYRLILAPGEIPRNVKEAFIASEDKRFLEHDGYDKIATARAAVKALATRVVNFRQQGASTITQQVARNVYLSDWMARQGHSELIVNNWLTRLAAGIKGPVWTNNATRKIREIKYAVQLEKGLTRQLGGRQAAKDVILTTYCNLVYFGHGVYGVGYGSHFFFDKPARELTVPEAAFLASIIPAPGPYARLTDEPVYRHLQEVRRNQTLVRMERRGFIARQSLPGMLSTPLALTARTVVTKTEAPALVQATLQELSRTRFSQDQLQEGRIQIHTTTRLDIQRIVRWSVQRNMFGEGPAHPGYKGRFAKDADEMPQVAVVVLRNHDGAVLAEFGGFTEERLYNYAMYNRATMSRRQPGSTFKGIDMVAAVMAGLTPDSIVMDAPAREKMGRDAQGNRIYKEIGDYDGRALGPIPLREASAQSRNLAFYHMMHDQVGNSPDAIAEAALLKAKTHQPVDPGAVAAIHWARELGITSELHPEIAVVLGANGVSPLEMANAYRAICSGIKAEPYLISSINDRTGYPFYTNEGHTSSLPVPPERLQMVQELLRGNIRLPKGTGHSLETSNFPIQVMGKTGTSNAHRDAWFVGCTYGPDGATALAWVGFDDFRKTLPYQDRVWYDRPSGGSVALPIVRDVFLNIYGMGKPLGEPPKMPEEIESHIDNYLVRVYPELRATK